jgi:YjzC-like protein
MMAQTIGLHTEFHTGQKCLATGDYQFNGYLDGTFEPLPTREERIIPLGAGETFPPIASTSKGCYWRLIYRL